MYYRILARNIPNKTILLTIQKPVRQYY